MKQKQKQKSKETWGDFMFVNEKRKKDLFFFFVRKCAYFLGGTFNEKPIQKCNILQHFHRYPMYFTIFRYFATKCMNRKALKYKNNEKYM